SEKGHTRNETFINFIIIHAYHKRKDYVYLPEIVPEIVQSVLKMIMRFRGATRHGTPAELAMNSHRQSGLALDRPKRSRKLF
ncbi:hypothetical protein ACFL4G_08510, partial [Thermodesulfobacteriota bacterium]